MFGMKIDMCGVPEEEEKIFEAEFLVCER